MADFVSQRAILQDVLDTLSTPNGARNPLLRLFLFTHVFYPSTDDDAMATLQQPSVFVGTNYGSTPLAPVLSDMCSINPVLALLHSDGDKEAEHFVLYFGHLLYGEPVCSESRVKGVEKELPGAVRRLPPGVPFVKHVKLYVVFDETQIRASPIHTQLSRFLGPSTPEFRREYDRLKELRGALSHACPSTRKLTDALAHVDRILFFAEPWHYTLGYMREAVQFALKSLLLARRPTIDKDEMRGIEAMVAMDEIDTEERARKRRRVTRVCEEEYGVICLQ